MCCASPRRVLAGLGILRTVCAEGSITLIGQADVNTRVAFTEALRDGLLQSRRSDAFTVDLSQLAFLSIGCAADLLLLASDSPHRHLRVRCAPAQAATLRRIGAEALPCLELVVGEAGCGC